MSTAHVRHLLLLIFLAASFAAKCGGPPLVAPSTAGLQLIPVRILRGPDDVARTKGGLWLGAHKDSLRVVFAFDNPCQDPIATGFRRRSDVIDIGFFDPTPRPDPTKPPYDIRACPAMINIVTYESTVPAVHPGEYTVNVFGSSDTTNWKPQFAEVHGRVVVPRTR